jgi:hypothetical protein
MPPRLHRGGRFRAWLGRALGGDEELGDRIWRRVLHGLGAFVLVYFALPTGFFVVVPKEYVLLAALTAVLLLEVGRHVAGLQLPTLRPYEEHRIASFAFFAVALTGAVLLFPLPIAAAVVLGVAMVDPLVGELRLRRMPVVRRWLIGGTVYVGLALLGLWLLGGWPFLPSLALALPAALLALAAEHPKMPWVDDDLAMTFVPALFLYAAGRFLLGLPV